MPLTAKGDKIKAALQKEYGNKRGESILYSGKNKGTFRGIDTAMVPQALGDVISGNKFARFQVALKTWKSQYGTGMMKEGNSSFDMRSNYKLGRITKDKIRQAYGK